MGAAAVDGVVQMASRAALRRFYWAVKTGDWARVEQTSTTSFLMTLSKAVKVCYDQWRSQKFYFFEGGGVGGEVYIFNNVK